MSAPRAPQSTLSYCAATPRLSTSWPLAPMATGSPPAAQIRRHAYGICKPAIQRPTRAYYTAMKIKSGLWPLVQTPFRAQAISGLPPAVSTTPPGCGSCARAIQPKARMCCAVIQTRLTALPSASGRKVAGTSAGGNNPTLESKDNNVRLWELNSPGPFNTGDHLERAPGFDPGRGF